MLNTPFHHQLHNSKIPLFHPNYTSTECSTDSRLCKSKDYVASSNNLNDFWPLLKKWQNHRAVPLWIMGIVLLLMPSFIRLKVKKKKTFASQWELNAALNQLKSTNVRHTHEVLNFLKDYSSLWPLLMHKHMLIKFSINLAKRFLKAY